MKTKCLIFYNFLTNQSVLYLFVISFFVQTMWSIQKFKKISLFSLLKNMWVAQKSNKYPVKIFLSFIHWNKNATSERIFLRDEDIKAKWCVSSWNYIIAHSCLTRQVFLAPFYLAIYVEWWKYWVSYLVWLFYSRKYNSLIIRKYILGRKCGLREKRLNLNQPH